MRLPFNHVGSPTRHKRWHQLTLEMDAAVDTVICILVDFGFGDPESIVAAEETFNVKGGGGY